MHYSGYYNLVSLIFGTTIPTSFNILVKCFYTCYNSNTMQNSICFYTCFTGFYCIQLHQCVTCQVSTSFVYIAYCEATASAAKWWLVLMH